MVVDASKKEPTIVKERQTHSGLPQPPGTVVAMVNRAMLIVTALTIATIFLIASFFPRPLVLPAMSELLTICAVVAAVVAIFRRQPFRAGYFTFWDKAALLMFLSLGAQILSDEQKVDAYFQTIRVEAATVTESRLVNPPITDPATTTPTSKPGPLQSAQ